MADVLIRQRTPHRIAQRQVFRGEVAGFRTLFCTTIRRSRAKPAVFCGFHAPASAKVSKLGQAPAAPLNEDEIRARDRGAGYTSARRLRECSNRQDDAHGSVFKLKQYGRQPAQYWPM